MDALLERLYQCIPKICATDAQLLKLHHYETAFDIFNHDVDNDRKNPLALIMMREAEKTCEPLFERMKEYRERQIKEYWGLSWLEFTNQPREVCDYQIQLALKAQLDGVQEDKKRVKTLEEIVGKDKT